MEKNTNHCCCSSSEIKDNTENLSGCPACEHFKAVTRDSELRKSLDNILNRIIGQLNGIKKMLDDNRYCGDVLTQISAVESALQNFGYIVLQNHMETCVSDQIRKGNEEIISETVALIKKLK